MELQDPQKGEKVGGRVSTSGGQSARHEGDERDARDRETGAGNCAEVQEYLRILLAEMSNLLSVFSGHNGVSQGSPVKR